MFQVDGGTPLMVVIERIERCRLRRFRHIRKVPMSQSQGIVILTYSTQGTEHRK